MKYKIILGLVAIMALISSCDDQELIDMNVNQNASTDIDMEYLFASSTVSITNDGGMMIRANQIYAASMIQHTADLEALEFGDKYTYEKNYSASLWGSYYGKLKNMTHVVDQTKGDPDRVNLYAMSLTMRAYLLHRITDMYGDCPYEQAGRGLDGQENWFPRYDAQEDIYGYLVRDLREARGLLNAGVNNIGGQDLIYQGDTAKWKKFINSLLIRIGMRMVKVDPATAQSVVEEAAANGAFTSDADEAFINHFDGPGVNTNGISHNLVVGDSYAADLRPGKTFMDWMAANNDPRFTIISGGTGDPFDDSTWDENSHFGLPNGFTNTTIVPWAVTEGVIAAPEDYSIDAFSFINMKIIGLDDKAYILTNAEVQLNLAEAAVRGWNVPGTAETNFVAGVNSAIDHWVNFDASLAVDPAVRDAYVASLGFAAAGNKLELIGEQYWAAQFLDHIEAWYNWRRVEFPVLTPVNFEGNISNGQIPRRLRYNENEIGGNPDSYAAAIAAQGPDEFYTRVWWDQ